MKGDNQIKNEKLKMETNIQLPEANIQHPIKYTMEELQNMDAADREELARHYAIKTASKHYIQLSCEIWDAQANNEQNQ